MHRLRLHLLVLSLESCCAERLHPDAGLVVVSGDQSLAGFVASGVRMRPVRVHQVQRD